MILKFKFEVKCLMQGKSMRKNLKKNICLILIMVSMLLYNSCSNQNSTDKKINIVCTAFPQYDFVKEIVGDLEEKFDIVYLFDNGADVHSFKTDISFNDKIQIINSDMFIYNGGDSDSWVDNILTDSSMNDKCKKISLIDCLDKNSLLELLDGESKHEHSNSCVDTQCEEVHDHSFDEHVWLSLSNATEICEKIYIGISELDPENKSVYERNYKNYSEKLLKLHDDSKVKIQEFQSPFLLIADRFPFVYLFNDYNIEYKAAFLGCTSETTATYENIISLCSSVEEKNVNSLLVLEKSTCNIASSIITTVGRDLSIYTLNSLQAVSKSEIDNGLTYYNVMKSNIDTILKSLEENQ